MFWLKNRNRKKKQVAQRHVGVRAARVSSWSQNVLAQLWLLIREGVGTSTIRTLTGQKFQNVEMVFLVDQNVESQKTTFNVVIILNAIGKIRTSKCFLTKATFDVLIFCNAIGKIRTSKCLLTKNWCKRSNFDVVTFSGNIRKIRTSKNVDICCNVII